MNERDMFVHIIEIPSYDVNEPRSTDRPRLLKQDDSLVLDYLCRQRFVVAILETKNQAP